MTPPLSKHKVHFMMAIVGSISSDMISPFGGCTLCLGYALFLGVADCRQTKFFTCLGNSFHQSRVLMGTAAVVIAPTE